MVINDYRITIREVTDDDGIYIHTYKVSDTQILGQSITYILFILNIKILVYGVT